MPVFDHHSAHIHAALLLLLATNRKDVARQWLTKMCHRLAYAFANAEYFPTTASFEDLLQMHHGYMEFDAEQLSTSSLTPILLTWFAALEMPEAYTFLREKMLKQKEKTTPNFWSSNTGYEHTLQDVYTLHQNGIGEPINEIPEGPKDFLEKMAGTLPGCTPISEFLWHKQGLAIIPLVAAIHWRLQIPRDAIVQSAAALCGVPMFNQSTNE